jgi:hypothetical protein
MDTAPGGPRFILSLFRVNPAYLRKMIGTGSGLDRLIEAMDENGGGPGGAATKAALE